MSVLMRTLAPLHSGDVQYRIVVLYTVGTIHTQGGGVLLMALHVQFDNNSCRLQLSTTVAYCSWARRVLNFENIF